jgi:hypothetical protein
MALDNEYQKCIPPVLVVLCFSRIDDVAYFTIQLRNATAQPFKTSSLCKVVVTLEGKRTIFSLRNAAKEHYF